MSRTTPDSYYRRAKQEGFAARSVYKLKEMDQRYGLVKRGNRALDLGCHPGSWLQWLGAKVGKEGLVVGVDIQPLKIKLAGNTRFLEADLMELRPEDLAPISPWFDVVLSDAAPRTTGVAHADTDRSLAMTEQALELALSLLRPGGSFAAKVYFGPGTDQLIKRVKGAFKLGKAHKPSASKAKSREIYLVGRGLKKAAPGG